MNEKVGNKKKSSVVDNWGVSRMYENVDYLVQKGVFLPFFFHWFKDTLAARIDYFCDPPSSICLLSTLSSFGVDYVVCHAFINPWTHW